MCAGKPDPANAPPRRGIRAEEKNGSAHRAVDDELHLAEEVGAERAVGVAQEQFPRRADSFDRGGEEAAVRQAVRMRRSQPVHAGAVVALQRVGIAPFEQCVRNRSSTSSRSNVRPAASAIDTGLGSAGSNTR